MKLEVGMYCYNKTNRKLGIGKIISFQRNNNVNIKYKNDIELVSIGNVEASNNIIDLIEVGDVVSWSNGRYRKSITKIDTLPNGEKYWCSGSMDSYRKEEMERITEIVTREQIESMQYKVD